MARGVARAPVEYRWNDAAGPPSQILLALAAQRSL